MNLVLASTGYKVPGYQNVDVNEGNLSEVVKQLPQDINELIIHRCLHLLSHTDLEAFLTKIYQSIVTKGILTIYCIDIYQFAHKIHRRDINEAQINQVLYEAGQKNCLSTLYYIKTCEALGFKKQHVSFDDMIAKISFIKE